MVGSLTNLAKSVQPLVFETGVEDFPYSAVGTVFLVGYRGKAYVVTTRHGLKPENPPPICIFPTDSSTRPLPLGQVFSVHGNDVPDDFMDLAVIDILPTRFEHPELGQATLIDIAKAYDDGWACRAENMELFVVGYPSDHSEINYEKQELRTDRVVLWGRYVGRSTMDYLHTFEANQSQGLPAFSGFSGGPVFGLQAQLDNCSKPILCGMAIRGTLESGLIHFLDASVLLDALKVKHQRDQAAVA